MNFNAIEKELLLSMETQGRQERKSHDLNEKPHTFIFPSQLQPYVLSLMFCICIGTGGAWGHIVFVELAGTFRCIGRFMVFHFRERKNKKHLEPSHASS